MFDNYEKFKKDVYALTKIDLNYYKEKQMRRRIDTIATKHGCSNYDEYIRVLKTDKDKFEAFVNFLTINVSEFYRNPDQWKLMDENVIPKLIKQHGKNLHVWSAACSTGDEPYSLVMALSKHIPLSNIQYFKQIGKSFQISDEIKRCVTFKEHNLLKDPYPRDFDMILCRNVVIYFTDDAKDMIYQKFHQSLKSHGVLFIGSTEQITNYKELGFDRLSSFYFEKNV